MSTKHRPSNLDLDKLKSASNKKFAIVCSEWNPEIINRLLEGAYDFFEEIGISKNKIDELKVPGSFELIFGCKVAIKHKPDSIIVIGSLIKGETKHFDFISNAVTNGIKDLNILFDIPVIFSVLTDNSLEQAINRSGGKYGNKGEEAAVAAVEMALLNKKKV